MNDFALLKLAFRLSLRELRAGLTGFWIFLACLAIGVAAISGIGSTSAALLASLDSNAREMLGGDAEFRLSQRSLPPDAVAWLETRGTVSAVRQLRGMIRRQDDSTRTLIELKSVDATYPLAGTVTTDPVIPLSDALSVKDGVPGILVDPLVLDRLGLAIGDEAVLGDAHVRVTAKLLLEPDGGAGAFSLGPHVLISAAGLTATGLDLPGTLSTAAYRVALHGDLTPDRLIAEANTVFPDMGWQTRDPAHASPGIDEFVQRTGMFLALVGLTALLVGGLGVANAVGSYLDAKRGVVATLKCLGAPARLIYATYLIQILILGLLGIAIGLALGALLPLVVQDLYGALLPVPLQVRLYPGPLLLASGFGVLIAIGFSLVPLAVARGFSPAALFRSAVAPGGRRLAMADRLALALFAVAVAALALITAADKRVAAWFLVSVVVCFGVFYGTGWLVQHLARRVGRPRLAWLRLAIANLYRPGAPTPVVVTSLGLGLTVLIAVALVEGALTTEIDGRVGDQAPSFFMIDIQPDQAAAFETLVRAMPGTEAFASVPSLRARIAMINGVPAAKAEIDPAERGLVESERGLTYAAAIPAGSTIVSGAWWPADYKGPPLVSMEQPLAEGLHLKIGDPITFDVAGRRITARLANTRHIDWTTLGLNFFTVFAPGTLEPAPQTRIATVRVADPAAEERLSRAVTEKFPNISVIRVKEQLERASHVLGGLAAAIRAVAAISIVAGGLVLAGAVASGHRRRLYDTVILKVLGATRATIARGLLVEYGIMGLVTAVIAIGFGTLGAWLLVRFVLHADWRFDMIRVGGTAAAGIGITILVAIAASARALRGRPTTILRNE